MIYNDRSYFTLAILIDLIFGYFSAAATIKFSYDEEKQRQRKVEVSRCKIISVYLLKTHHIVVL